MSEFHLTKTDNNQDYSIKQGASFALPIKYLGFDYSLWTPRGQIRRKYAYQVELEDILAEFSFSSITYNGTDDYSLVTAFLTPTQTEALPVLSQRRKTSRDAVIIGTNVFVYDIELESPTGDVIRDPYGYVEILPEVTR